MKLSPTLITDPRRLVELRPAWEGLLARSSNDAIMLHPHWMLPWWDVFGSCGRRTLRSIAFFEGDHLVGFAPLVSRPHLYRPGIPFRRLETLASGEDRADETCSDYLGIIAERDREGELASAFAEALSSGACGGWDEILLPAMSGEGPLPVMLRDALLARGLYVSLKDSAPAAYVPLPRTWDAYLSALKPNKRSQLKKSLRTFEEWADGPPVIARVRFPSELAEGKRILLALHRERWSAEGSEGVFASPRFAAFHDRVMSEMFAAGMLDLGWLSVRGEPIAAFYNLRHAGKIYFYQSGRNLEVPAEVRVGVAMHAYLIRAAIEEGLREYDFLAGTSQYKMSLALATRPIVNLRAARPSAVEMARRTAERVIDGAKILRDHARRGLPSAAAPKPPRRL